MSSEQKPSQQQDLPEQSLSVGQGSSGSSIAVIDEPPEQQEPVPDAVVPPKPAPRPSKQKQPTPTPTEFPALPQEQPQEQSAAPQPSARTLPGILPRAVVQRPMPRTVFTGRLKHFRRNPGTVPRADQLDTEFQALLKYIFDQLDTPICETRQIKNPNLGFNYLLRPNDQERQFEYLIVMPSYLQQTILTKRDIIRLAKTIYGTGYQLDNLIGKGSYGSVFYSHIFASENDPDVIGIPVGIKIVSAPLRNLSYQLSVELAISQLLSTNPHQNILQFFEVFSSPSIDVGYFVMEWADLKDLEKSLMWNFDIITGSWTPFTHGQARHFIRQIALGVQHLHYLNIAHMDLKLNNVVLFSPNRNGYIKSVEDIQAKITDFGLAQPNSQQEFTGKLMRRNYNCSTLLTGAPECRLKEYIRKNSDSFKIDIYAVGVMLAQMVIGKDPFREGSDKYAFMSQFNIKYMTIIKMNVKYLENGLLKNYNLQGDKQLIDLLRRTLEPDFKKRYTIEHILKHPWLVDASFTPISGLNSHIKMVDGFGQFRKSIDNRFKRRRGVSI